MKNVHMVIIIVFTIILAGMNTYAVEDTALLQNIVISGTVEVEAGFVNSDITGDDTSDIVLSTVELGVDAMVVGPASGHVLFLYEEDDTPLDVDEGYIMISDKDKCPAYMQVGLMYVPFGNFETNMVSDPLTLELAETRESAILVGMDLSGMYGRVYAFNGDVDEYGEDDKIQSYGVALGYAIVADAIAVDAGIGWTSNMFDSDAIGDHMDENSAIINDAIPGFAVHAVACFEPFVLICEYVAATDDPEVDYGSGFVENDSPWACNIEIGYTHGIMGKETTFGAAWQATDNCLFLELPETRLLCAMGVEVVENLGVSLEYAYDTDYDESDGGTDENASTITVQLALEF